MALLASCSPVERSGIRVESDAQAVGARVYLNGRYAGTMERMYWITASPFDSIPGEPSMQRAVVDSSMFGSQLNSSARGRGRCRILVLGPHGERLSTVAALAESTSLGFNLASGKIWVAPVHVPRPPNGNDDDGEGYHDDPADTVVGSLGHQ